MSTSNLTAKYRPQTFGDVAGQEAIKSILSRAAASDKIAPAYLFSGTRGVGKTTIARIFAKALNCVNAPTAEPCNECSNCKQITAGVAVDVIEIDGASNRGIDDARRLKEDIGYAPVECRYKVFIIDEAHMLTKEAFNALLKTLEEPPPRATFIMATTEPHKFPPTIISRCQHYIYKMLTQQELVNHLESIMNMEELPFEPGALEIIAKRGAGSVRDSMSLLGQALAMGSDVLREEEVRNFLGLAGQDVFFQLMEAMHSRDLVAVGMVLRQVLDQGLDLGFFLRELTNCWRNMFLLRQAGEKALPLLGMSGEEARAWLEWAGKFDPSHIHACWQMTLDGQRKVMTSLEPALALELLLLNLTSLPDLINLESVGSAPTGGTPPPPPGQQGGNFGGGQQGPQGGGYGQQGGGFGQQSGQRFAPPPKQSSVPAQPAAPSPHAQQNHVANSTMPTASRQQAAPVQQQAEVVRKQVAHGSEVQESHTKTAPASSPVDSNRVNQPLSDSKTFTPKWPRNWEGFLEFVNEKNGKTPVKAAKLRLNKGELRGDELVITCGTRMQCAQLSEKQTFNALDSLTREYFGPLVEVKVETGDIAVHKTDKQLREEAEAHPGVKMIMDTFSAQLISVSHRKQ
tara:strand:- start:3652 stop:5535 length:1884 start_codon:yes stop_codon:yes gene_type:complete